MEKNILVTKAIRPLTDYSITSFFVAYTRIQNSLWNRRDTDQQCTEYMGNSLPHPFPTLECPG